jgi:hypothetical protein
MANRLYNKQVSPKGYKKGGSVRDTRKTEQMIGASISSKREKGRTRKMGGGMMMERPMMQKGGSLKAVQPNQKGLKKLPTEVRNKMGYMKKGGVVSDAKKKQFKENKAGQKVTNKKAMKIAKGVLNFAVPAVGAAEVGKKIARKFKGAK